MSCVCKYVEGEKLENCQEPFPAPHDKQKHISLLKFSI